MATQEELQAARGAVFFAEQRGAVQKQIDDVDRQIADLQAQRITLTAERTRVETQLENELGKIRRTGGTR